jgi:arylformamidase
VDVFRAGNPRGAANFIHGGNWSRLHHADFSWTAESLLAQDLSVVFMNYPPCPEVRIPEILASTRAAFAFCQDEQMTEAERRHLPVIGQPAGGCLAADLLTREGDTPIAGVLTISALYDLRSLLHTAGNAYLQLDEPAAARISLITQAIATHAPLRMALGGLDTAEFQRQSALPNAAWPAIAPEPPLLLGCRNHFTVVYELLPNGALVTRIPAWSPRR